VKSLLLAASATVLLLSSCRDGVVRGPEKKTPGFVAVTLQYPETPPAGAEAYIRIVEISGPDRALVGSLKAHADLPEFKVEYRNGRIRQDQTYGLEIVVMAEGKSVFHNKKPYLVLTQGHPDRVTAEVERK
jgi:hypothetical protein